MICNVAGCAQEARSKGLCVRHYHPMTAALTADLCGTVAGYARHYRAGERACDECRAANIAYRRARALTAECGTYAGYRGHQARHEKPCEACYAVRKAHWDRSNATRREGPRKPQPDLPRWESAACRGLDTEMFFPHRTDSKTAAAAIAVCDGCPIRVACAAWAVERGERGVWGGLTDEQREQLRRGGREASDLVLARMGAS